MGAMMMFGGVVFRIAVALAADVNDTVGDALFNDAAEAFVNLNLLGHSIGHVGTHVFRNGHPDGVFVGRELVGVVRIGVQHHVGAPAVHQLGVHKQAVVLMRGLVGMHGGNDAGRNGGLGWRYHPFEGVIEQAIPCQRCRLVRAFRGYDAPYIRM